MGDIISAIADDIDNYVGLCQRYGEKVQYSGSSEDCYGEHATRLKRRARLDDGRPRATEEYRALCEKYHEHVRRDGDRIDCYGPHAQSLRKREKSNESRREKRALDTRTRRAKSARAKLTDKEFEDLIWGHQSHLL